MVAKKQSAASQMRARAADEKLDDTCMVGGRQKRKRVDSWRLQDNKCQRVEREEKKRRATVAHKEKEGQKKKQQVARCSLNDRLRKITEQCR